MAIVAVVSAGCLGGPATAPSAAATVAASATSVVQSPTVAVSPPVVPSPTRTAGPTSAAAVIEFPWEMPANATYEQLVPLFAYHADSPLTFTEKAPRQEDGATIRDITYTGEAGQPVDAYLVVPAGKGPFPAVLFEHGMGDNRDQLIDEAVTLARQQHVVGLVPTRPVTLATSGTDEAILQIREMRHGFDVLASQPGVDKSRLGYVGFSMGAVLGAEIVAFEGRIKTAVLMEGVPSVAQSWLDTNVLAPHATKASLLFMFGHGDTYYHTDDANAWAALFKGQTQVLWYDQGHSPSDAFNADCTKWLATHL